jgi:hypothetical protein
MSPALRLSAPPQNSTPWATLGVRLESCRQKAHVLHAMWVATSVLSDSRDAGSRAGLLSARSSLAGRLKSMEDSISQLERCWIQRLIRTELCANRRLSCAVSIAPPLRLPVELWGRVLEFLGPDESVLELLDQVDLSTSKVTREAYAGLLGQALRHPLLERWREGLFETSAESRLVRWKEIAQRLRDPAFLLSEQGCVWTDEARNQRASVLVQRLGEELVCAAVSEAQARGWEEDLDPLWWCDRLFAAEAAGADVSCLHRIDASLAYDRSFVLQVCAEVPNALLYLPQEWRADREVIRACFQQLGADGFLHPIRLAAEALRDDEDLAREAIATRSDGYGALSSRLRAHRGLAMQAIRQDYTAYRDLPRDLKQDVELAFEACRQNPLAFKLVSHSLRLHPALNSFRLQDRPIAPLFALGPEGSLVRIAQAPLRSGEERLTQDAGKQGSV